ncbi:MAG: CHRD domain-containing protein [Actinobacteria bacterium]|nr:CHRD domain-containing protein [Actinomycetota bacterium]
MRTRLVLVVFVLGMVAVGAAVAGLNRSWSTHANGEIEVPARATNAQGQAIFHLSKDGTEVEYRLIASNIENVVQAHIHLGPPGVNGPIVAFLFGPVGAGGGRHNGVLSTGTITAANLIGPLLGQSLSALTAALNGGNAYVNIHTSDGVAPADTGPGDFPGGEIRGDIG